MDGMDNFKTRFLGCVISNLVTVPTTLSLPEKNTVSNYFEQFE